MKRDQVVEVFNAVFSALADAEEAGTWGAMAMGGDGSDADDEGGYSDG
jgi:hypothetical protein